MVLIEAPLSNTGYIYIAGDEDSASDGNGHRLGAGECLEIQADSIATDGDHSWLDLYELWWDGDTTGNKLVVSYLKQVSFEY